MNITHPNPNGSPLTRTDTINGLNLSPPISEPCPDMMRDVADLEKSLPKRALHISLFYTYRRYLLEPTLTVYNSPVLIDSLATLWKKGEYQEVGVS